MKRVAVSFDKNDQQTMRKVWLAWVAQKDYKPDDESLFQIWLQWVAGILDLMIEVEEGGESDAGDR